MKVAKYSTINGSMDANVGYLEGEAAGVELEGEGKRKGVGLAVVGVGFAVGAFVGLAVGFMLGLAVLAVGVPVGFVVGSPRGGIRRMGTVGAGDGALVNRGDG